ncbi:MAG: hypothetical protein KKB30_12055 [Proteobacteria bacterium]|nr:hypothetical protein [Pseudomonadota bacterium]MBU1716630.1 hypothetical protein [Pseudomonadota bacterium]
MKVVVWKSRSTFLSRIARLSLEGKFSTSIGRLAKETWINPETIDLPLRHNNHAAEIENFQCPWNTFRYPSPNYMKIDNFSPITIQIIEQKAGPATTTAPVLQETLDLAVGRLFEARVIGSSQNGNLLLDLDGRTLTAKSQIPLTVGDTLWLEVKQTGPPPILALAGEKAATSNLLRLLFSNSPQLDKTINSLSTPAGLESSAQPTTVNQLVSLLNEISFNSRPDIARIIKATSLFLPSQDKAEISPAQIILKQILNNIKTAENTGLKGVASLLEAIQNVNSSHTATTENPGLFIFPCFFTSSTGWGEWMLFLDQEENHRAGQKIAFTLEFFLEMSQLGEIHLQTIFSDQGVKGSFSVTSEEAIEHLKSSLAELENTIEELGYRPISLTCRKSEETVLRKLKTTLEKKSRLPSINIVDIKA